jgi:hypothetical protein
MQFGVDALTSPPIQIVERFLNWQLARTIGLKPYVLQTL